MWFGAPLGTRDVLVSKQLFEWTLRSSGRSTSGPLLPTRVTVSQSGTSSLLSKGGGTEVYPLCLPRGYSLVNPDRRDLRSKCNGRTISFKVRFFNSILNRDGQFPWVRSSLRESFWSECYFFNVSCEQLRVLLTVRSFVTSVFLISTFLLCLWCIFFFVTT